MGPEDGPRRTSQASVRGVGRLLPPLLNPRGSLCQRDAWTGGMQQRNRPKDGTAAVPAASMCMGGYYRPARPLPRTTRMTPAACLLDGRGQPERDHDGA